MRFISSAIGKTSQGNMAKFLAIASIATIPALTTFTPQASALDLLDKTKSDKQRKIYLEARQAFKKQQSQRYQQLKKQLTDYPLYPYLLFSELNKQITKLPYKEIDHFFTTYPDSYLEDTLRKRWLSHLASIKYWRTYERYYEPGLRSAKLDCYNVRAMMNSGKAFPEDQAMALWLSPKSQPDECDPVFAAMSKKGLLTTDVIWARYKLSMDKRNLGLARYLRKRMPTDVRKLAELYEQVHKTPSQVTVVQKFSKHSDKVADIVYHGLHRYAHAAPEKTLAHFNKISTTYTFDQERQIKLKNRIAAKLISKDKLDSAVTVINSLGIDERGETIERLLRVYLKNRQWDKISQWVDKLPEELATSDRWQYWKARSLEAMAAFDNNDTDFHSIYQALSEKRSFYGFLAADKKQQNYFFEDKPATVNLDTVTRVRQLPAIQRARELFLLSDMHRARREWAYGIRGFEEPEFVAAGQLSHLWGWHRKAIEVMAKAKNWDDLSIRFPVVHEGIVKKNARLRNIPDSLVLAIARQESAWEFDARSRVGARGLMQLMPATARETAKKAGVRYSKRKLYEPSYNIALGSRYISGLLKRYNNNRPLAIAAYNAGPHRVKEWLKRSQSQLPTDVWIEVIPFNETRKYVQNVLSYEVIYNYRRGQGQQLLTLAESGAQL